MLYILNLHSTLCLLHLNKTGRKKNGIQKEVKKWSHELGEDIHNAYIWQKFIYSNINNSYKSMQKGKQANKQWSKDLNRDFAQKKAYPHNP